MANLTLNKRARYDYKLIDRYEAGIVLLGQEVKSIKLGQASLKGSFVTLKGKELYLTNANIPRYKMASALKPYEPARPRKLLLKKAEIKSLTGKMKSQGLTLVPLRLYTKNRLIKLEFALARGKRKYDKRQTISKREDQRKMDRRLKEN